MNQANDLSSEIAGALRAMIEAQRMAQVASDQMDEAFATLLGVNRTDMRCLDIVHRLGRVTAGDLAREAGLTSGAVTALLDRMERAGYLRREPDPADRRKVQVVPSQRIIDLAATIYGQIGQVGQGRMGGMPPDHMQIVTRYLRSHAWLNAELARRLRDEIAAHPKADGPQRAQSFATGIARDIAALDQGLVRAWQGEAANL
jgi:DNA-binding MarR family transcriptional regulator